MPETVPPGVRAVAVGWLNAEHPYSRGSSDEGFVRMLFEACRSRPSSRTRGWHKCELCSAQGTNDYPPTVTYDRDTIGVGDAELRVIGRDGGWLIAPTLIIHYVLQHEYAPPPEFVEAVVAERFAEELERHPAE